MVIAQKLRKLLREQAARKHPKEIKLTREEAGTLAAELISFKGKMILNHEVRTSSDGKKMWFKNIPVTFGAEKMEFVF